MKVVVIHGQNHKGSTYNIADILAHKVSDEVTEFMLPRDLPDFCLGCTTCFIKGEDKCPHREYTEKIINAIDEADLIILASPVYVFHTSSPMKNLLDHMGFRWMPHRPEASMFKKQAVAISTAAGSGMKSTNKDMVDSLFFWGVAKIYKLGFAVRATSYEAIPEKRKKALLKKIDKIALKINKKNGKVKPGFKLKFMFGIMRLFQKNGYNERDINHWKDRGWLGKKRPWKK